MDQDASGCGYFLHSKQLAGCTEYGMPHNVEGAPREEERKHMEGEPPAVPGVWSSIVSWTHTGQLTAWPFVLKRPLCWGSFKTPPIPNQIPRDSPKNPGTLVSLLMNLSNHR